MNQPKEIEVLGIKCPQQDCWWTDDIVWLGTVDNMKVYIAYNPRNGDECYYCSISIHRHAIHVGFTSKTMEEAIAKAKEGMMEIIKSVQKVSGRFI